MPHQPSNGILEEFRIEFLDCWNRLPNKGFFLVLLALWLALFQFLGNSALGYIRTPSLLHWMWTVYSARTADGVAEEVHGKLIPLVVLGLFWWKRKQLLSAQLRLWWPGLLLVGLGLFIHLVGFAVEPSRISIVGLFTGIYGLMGLAWGPQWLRRSFFPFFLLGFCIPLTTVLQPVTFTLQVLVTKAVTFVSNSIFGIGIIRNGTELIEPGGQWRYSVAAPCSGIHSLIATSAIAVIYALLSFRSWWRIGLMVASAVPLAMAGNILRMMSIVFSAELGGQEWGNTVHEGGPLGIWSLLPYLPVFAGVLFLGSWLREPESAGRTREGELREPIAASGAREPHEKARAPMGSATEADPV